MTVTQKQQFLKDHHSQYLKILKDYYKVVKDFSDGIEENFESYSELVDISNNMQDSEYLSMIDEITKIKEKLSEYE